jgi:hypothetical protein
VFVDFWTPPLYCSWWYFFNFHAFFSFNSSCFFYVSLKMLIGPVRMTTIVVLQFNLFLLLIDFTYSLLSVVVLSLW